MTSRTTRRAFVQTAMTCGGLLATRPTAAFATIEQDPELRGAHDDDIRYPLQTPADVPASLSILTCAPASVNMGDGRLRQVLAYNGRFPGPTWEARTGDWITVQLQNGLSDETITHWHGLVVDYLNDGGPRLAIAPGGPTTTTFRSTSERV